MAKSTTVVWASFPSHEEARQIKDRLVANGFAGNSIEIHRKSGGPACDVAVHTREHNLQKVHRLLHGSGPVYALRQATEGAIKSATRNPLVVGGGIALVGLLAYALLPRNRRTTVQTIRELPRALRDLPDTVARAAPEAAKHVVDRFYSPSEGREGSRTGAGRS